MKLFFLLLLNLILSVSTWNDQIYCNTSLCPRDTKHVACGHTRQFDHSCPKDAKIIQLNDIQKRSVVDAHNSLRNEIALGMKKGFKSASKMLTMSWDEELANLAALNVMKCKMEHDTCNTTPQLNLVGQNIAIQMNKFHRIDVMNSMLKAIHNWFNEIQLANQNDIDKCCSRTNVIGHFTQIVQENANKVGCAVSRYSKNGIFSTLITCN